MGQYIYHLIYKKMAKFKILEGSSKDCEDSLNSMATYKEDVEVVAMTMGKNDLRIIVKYR